MSSHLNLFEPYERKGAHYEDALTRAFLIVLRGVPLAHAAWLHLVDLAHRRNSGKGIPLLHELVVPTVLMQTAKIPADAVRVVSLVQTDEHVAVAHDAKPSDRRQVLDGVVGYGDFVIAIENKPWHGDIWTEQLHLNLPAGAQLDERIACVVWSDIVSAWGRLLDSNHLNRAEGLLVGDFIAYVERHFPGLYPYSRVRLCGIDHDRLTRRCKAVLTRIAGADRVDYHQGWGWYIDLLDGQCARKIGLFPEFSPTSPRLVIEIDPGDTMGQARLMYRDVSLERVDALLGQPGWQGRPNFHLLFMTSTFFRPGHRHGVHDYWSRWMGQPERIRLWKRNEFDAAFATLLELDMVTPEDRAAFDHQTVATKRDNVCFAPGVKFQWHLPLDEAARLDDRDQLEVTIEAAIDQGCSALELRRPSGSASVR